MPERKHFLLQDGFAKYSSRGTLRVGNNNIYDYDYDYDYDYGDDYDYDYNDQNITSLFSWVSPSRGHVKLPSLGVQQPPKNHQNDFIVMMS